MSASLQAFSLSPSRLATATNTTDDILVLADPGAGKTHLMVAHAVHAAETLPGRVVMLTFAKFACREIRRRVSAVSSRAKNRIVVRTIHSHALEIVCVHGTRLGVSCDVRPIAGGELIRYVATELKMSEAHAKTFVELLEERQRMTRRFATVPSVSEQLLYDQLHTGLALKNRITYGRAVELACALLHDPEVATSVHRHDTSIMIDEVQDCDPAQLDFVDSICGRNHRFVAMDPNQSLYGWKQADPAMSEAWARARCPLVVPLTQNFRCPPAIHKAATAVLNSGLVTTTVDVHVQQYGSRESEAIAVRNQLSRATGTSAILAPANWCLDTIEQVLTSEQILCVRRSRGWSALSEKLLGWLAFMERVRKRVQTPSDSIQQMVADIERSQRTPQQVCHDLCSVLKVPPSDVRRLLGTAHECETLAALLKRSSVTPDAGESHEGTVVLATFHGAKGLEFQNVWVVGLEKRVIPHHRTPDFLAARRALYVAITRASERVFLSNVKERTSILRV